MTQVYTSYDLKQLMMINNVPQRSKYTTKAAMIQVLCSLRIIKKVKSASSKKCKKKGYRSPQIVIKKRKTRSSYKHGDDNNNKQTKSNDEKSIGPENVGEFMETIFG